MYKSIKSQPCPRGFDGIVRIKNVAPISSKKSNSPGSNSTLSTKSLSCNLHWSKPFGDDGPIVWTSVLHSGHHLPFDEHACLLVSFVYRVPDLSELRQVTNARATQNKCQESKNINLDARLVEENEDNDDDVLCRLGTYRYD